MAIKQLNLGKNRPSADPTRNRILQSAKKLFVKQGFAATSISQIASKANINQSLIYHHFGSKQQLWKAVKAYLLEKEEASPLVFDSSAGLKVFLEKVLRHRFDIYLHNPDLSRMVSWQRLETSSKELTGNPYLGPEHWREPIIELQKRGELRADLDPDIVITMIISIIPGAFIAGNPLLANNKYKSKECFEQILSCLLQAFSTGDLAKSARP